MKKYAVKSDGNICASVCRAYESVRIKKINSMGPTPAAMTFPDRMMYKYVEISIGSMVVPPDLTPVADCKTTRARTRNRLYGIAGRAGAGRFTPG
jgi:hypothetical protein